MGFGCLGKKGECMHTFRFMAVEIYHYQLNLYLFYNYFFILFSL